MRALAGGNGRHDFVIARADDRHIVRNRIGHIGEPALRIESDVSRSQPDFDFTDHRVIPAIDHRDRVRSRVRLIRPTAVGRNGNVVRRNADRHFRAKLARRRRARSRLDPDRSANKPIAIRRDARKQRTPSRRSRRDHLIVRRVDDRDIVRAAVGDVKSFAVVGQFQMRWIIAGRNMFFHPPRRRIDDRDAIVRRIGINPPIAMAHHRMRAAQVPDAASSRRDEAPRQNSSPSVPNTTR